MKQQETGTDRIPNGGWTRRGILRASLAVPLTAAWNRAAGAAPQTPEDNPVPGSATTLLGAACVNDYNRERFFEDPIALATEWGLQLTDDERSLLERVKNGEFEGLRPLLKSVGDFLLAKERCPRWPECQP